MPAFALWRDSFAAVEALTRVLWPAGSTTTEKRWGDDMPTVNLTTLEAATILAALRRWRRTCWNLGEDALLATLDGSATPLTDAQVQQLEEKILNEKP